MTVSQSSDFQLAGEFLGYELKGHQIRYINLSNELGRYRLKLSSEARDDLLRAALKGELQVGDQMEVIGYQRRKSSGEVKLKVTTIVRTGAPESWIGSSSQGSAPIQPLVLPTAPGPKAQVLICQKSNCCKRGGKGLCQAFEQGIEERGLGGHVRIKPTGCLKKCGKGPNVIVGKTRLHQVQIKDVPQILNKHFAAQIATAQAAAQSKAETAQTAQAVDQAVDQALAVAS